MILTEIRCKDRQSDTQTCASSIPNLEKKLQKAHKKKKSFKHNLKETTRTLKCTQRELEQMQRHLGQANADKIRAERHCKELDHALTEAMRGDDGFIHLKHRKE